MGTAQQPFLKFTSISAPTTNPRITMRQRKLSNPFLDWDIHQEFILRYRPPDKKGTMIRSTSGIKGSLNELNTWLKTSPMGAFLQLEGIHLCNPEAKHKQFQLYSREYYHALGHFIRKCPARECDFGLIIRTLSRCTVCEGTGLYDPRFTEPKGSWWETEEKLIIAAEEAKKIHKLFR